MFQRFFIRMILYGYAPWIRISTEFLIPNKTFITSTGLPKDGFSRIVQVN